ncbi:centromere/kinetochore protein zw10 homolog [Antedon mediterranea]|uniref:centromere/kinetochore protein zw10 homolog n=1 Tax=Antedon mediterranea TaxID=105859 RepID=UPI003AF5B977
MWKQIITWKAPQMELHIAHDDHVNNMVISMHKVGILNSKIQSFGKDLLKHVFTPVITNPSVQCAIAGKSKITTIVFKKVNSFDAYVQPQKVYHDILKVLKGLESALLEIKVMFGEEEEQQKSLMYILGMAIWKDLSDVLINNCLVKSIPTTNSQLTGYNSVIRATEDFEKSLETLGFISAGASSLLSYAKDVNIHFANKKCRDIIVEARNLMKQDLHNTVVVGLNDDDDDVEKKQETEKEKVVNGDEKRTNYVSSGTFKFPRCKISITTQQIVNLAYDTLLEATKSSQQCAIQLFQTTRSMFDLYCAVIPTYHKDSLAKFPQLSALHYNNCMYIAHHLLTLGHQYRSQLPPPLCQGSATFVDGIPQFRHLATDCFMEQMRTQRNQLIEYLSGAGYMNQVSSGENYKTAERAFKQVLHQLNHLHAVWSDVLPPSVFTKAIGTLVNTVFQHVIDKLVSLEDISTNDANQLHALMTMLIEGTPETLQPKNNQVLVATVVPHWATFEELMFILEASLQGIVDRWVDGKGPLAVVFQPNEVKSLIRALFKNTDRRANALTKIRL